MNSQDVKCEIRTCNAVNKEVNYMRCDLLIFISTYIKFLVFDNTRQTRTQNVKIISIDPQTNTKLTNNIPIHDTR